MKNEVLVFHADAILRSGTDFTITVDPSSLLPELSALRHARVREDLESPISIIYTNRRTGRIDPSKIAVALKYTDRAEVDRDAACRKLAQHLIAQLWAGEQLDPAIPYAFWDHNAMMDEYEASMQTTEWLEASPQIRQGFLALYEKHRAFLDQIQAAQAQATTSQQMRSAIAQTTQQVAARVAAETIDESLAQIRESLSMAHTQPQPQPVPGGRPVQAEMAVNAARGNGSPQGRLAATTTGPSPAELTLRNLLPQ
jgi:hypothetical protein